MAGWASRLIARYSISRLALRWGRSNTVVYNSLRFPTSNTPSFNIDFYSLRLGRGFRTRIRHDAQLDCQGRGDIRAARHGFHELDIAGSPTFPANAVFNARFNTSVAVIRAGLNYKFDWFGRASNPTPAQRHHVWSHCMDPQNLTDSAIAILKA